MHIPYVTQVFLCVNDTSIYAHKVRAITYSESYYKQINTCLENFQGQPLPAITQIVALSG